MRGLCFLLAAATTACPSFDKRANSRPEATVSGPERVENGSDVRLFAAGRDSDGEVTAFEWSVDAAPAPNAFVLTSDGTSEATVTPSMPSSG